MCINISYVHSKHIATHITFLKALPIINFQKLDIPTMETGCEVAKRAYKELTDIQVCS